MSKTDFIKKLNNIKVALFDLDGTLYLGNNVFVGAKDTLNALRKRNIKVVFFTNNSSKTPDEYEVKLKEMGLFENEDYILTSGEATMEFILKAHKNKKVYLLGTEKLKKLYRDGGINVVDENAELAVLAYDTEINYKKICEFNKQLVSGAFYIATHPDDVCPSSDGDLPDVGSFIQMFLVSSARQPDEIVGKPNSTFGDIVLNKFGVERENCLMVGDRLYTDIRFGKNCSFLTVLTLSGETKAEMLGGVDQPDYIIDNVADLKDFI